jgi:microcystin degradation protein MlrC
VRAHELFGDDIRRAHDGAATVVAGYLAACARLGWDVVPLSYCELVPCGPLLPEARSRVEHTFRQSLRGAGRLDAVLVCLHGAAVSTDEPDLDGALLSALRDEVGDDVPVAVVLDLHANVSHRMVAHSDVILGYRTNPHVDARDRAEEATDLLGRCLRAGRRPVSSDVAVPAVVSILAQGTGDEPMASLMAEAARAEREPEVLSVSLFQGFPWSDTPDTGMSVVVLAETDQAVADEVAGRLARSAWRARERFVAAAPAAAAALASRDSGTTLLLDVGDNVGGGGPGDATHLLAAAVDAGARSLLAVIKDADAAEQAVSDGPEAPVDLRVGRPPMRLRGTVLAVADGRYEDTGPTHVGHRFFDAGPSAAVRLVTGQTVVLCSKAVMPSSVQQLAQLGLRPRDFRFVCAKGVHSPLAGYRPHVDRTVFVDTPGVTQNDIRGLRYRRRPVPLFPLDDVAAEPELLPRRSAS